MWVQGPKHLVYILLGALVMVVLVGAAVPKVEHLGLQLVLQCGMQWPNSLCNHKGVH